MEVLFDFKGEIDNHVLRFILKTMDEKMEGLGEDRFVRKKINSILIECLQNLIFHAEKPREAAENPGLYIARDANGYEIRTTNLVTPAKAQQLQEYIDRINQMDEDGLRNLYQEVLTNGKFNPQGGAGLGIINIARRTANRKLTYDFQPATDHNLIFEMGIHV